MGVQGCTKVKDKAKLGFFCGQAKDFSKNFSPPPSFLSKNTQFTPRN